MNENWRDSEAQAIGANVWTRLNGTDAEILIEKAAVIRVRRHRPQQAGTYVLPLAEPITEPGLYAVEFTAGHITSVRKVSE